MSWPTLPLLQSPQVSHRTTMQHCADWSKAWWFESAYRIQTNMICAIWLQLLSLIVINKRVPLLTLKDLFGLTSFNWPRAQIEKWYKKAHIILLRIYSFWCYVLACRPNMATTLQAFQLDYHLWHSDWLKMLGDWQPRTLHGDASYL